MYCIPKQLRRLADRVLLARIRLDQHLKEEGDFAEPRARVNADRKQDH
jgi:hypothetical protein